VKTRSTESHNIYTESLGINNQSSSDSLWYSVLLYYISIYDAIRDRNVNFFKGQTSLLDEFLGRLDSFSTFLIQKEKDLATYQFFLSTPKKKPVDDFEYYPIEVESVSTQQSTIPKPKPQVMPGNNDYPVNSTSTLISRMIQMVERTYLLVEVLRRLAFVNIPEDKEPTFHQMLTNKEAQATLRSRVFRSMKLDDPLLARI